MNDPKRVWAWVGVAVIVIAVIAWVVWKPSPVTAPVASNPAPVYAPQGQLVPQFPKNLILDSNAAISTSYSVPYSTSTNQYTAEYYSSSTIAELYDDYLSYLQENNWTITSTFTAHPTFNVIAASQGDNQVQVVIGTESGESQVTISYVGQ